MNQSIESSWNMRKGSRPYICLGIYKGSVACKLGWVFSFMLACLIEQTGRKFLDIHWRAVLVGHCWPDSPWMV